jgi:hypothetical protein
MPMPQLKTIKISVKYEEDGSTLKHSLSHEIKTHKPVGEILAHLRDLDKQITGQESLL